MNDRWAGARSYERFMGRWSRELAHAFVRWLPVVPQGNWLEIGCGTGALTSCILELSSPASVLATDTSAQFVNHARGTIKDPRVQFTVAGIGALPACIRGYDAVVSSLVLNFLPDPAAAIREMWNLAAEGGVTANCVWDYAGEMQFLRKFWDAAVHLDPAARPLDEGVRFPICSPDGLRSAFERAGISQVQIQALEIPTIFQNFDDYWEPFVGGPGPAPGYLSSLTAEKQQQLERLLRATLPYQADGSLALTARAWAACASKRA